MTIARMPSGTISRPAAAAPRQLVPRHSALVRITHWVNVFCFSLLLMSGAQIFNAHRFNCKLDHVPHVMRVHAACMMHDAFSTTQPSVCPDAE